MSVTADVDIGCILPGNGTTSIQLIFVPVYYVETPRPFIRPSPYLIWACIPYKLRGLSVEQEGGG